MKIGSIMVNAAYLGERVLTAIAVGATKVCEGVSKYIKFADPVVEQICMKWSSDGIGLTSEDAAQVTDIGNIFQGNTDITSFDEFREFTSVKKTEGLSFKGCSNLRSITFPDSIEILGSWSFESCALENVVLTENIATIESGCFAYGGMIKKLTIKGSRQRTFGPYCFSQQQLIEVNVDNIETIFNINFLSTTSTPLGGKSSLRVGGNVITDIVVPKEVTKINSYLFYTNATITSIKMEGVTDIGAGSIQDIKTLKNVEFSDCLINIGNSAFTGCEYVKTWNLPASVAYIGASCFNWCPGMEQFICNAVVPPQLGGEIFAHSSNCQIYVPDESVDAYKSATNWSAYAGRIKPLSEFVEPTND